MAVTRFERLTGADLTIGGNVTYEGDVFTYPTTFNLYAAAQRIFYVSSGSWIADQNLSFATRTKYPNCVAVGASTEANKTYFKVQAAGTIKRVICYDDA